MKKSKIIISIMLLITLLLNPIYTYAKTIELMLSFDGENISLESEDAENLNIDLENFLPGDSDTSAVTIKNTGERKATLETTISITEDTGLLEKIDLTITNKDGETVYEGSYTEFETLRKDLDPNETETYTVVTSLNVNAGNEYQDKQYNLNFSFKAIGEIPVGTLTVRYLDENGDQLQEDEVTTGKINQTYTLPETGKEFEGYNFNRYEGDLSGKYQEAGTTVTYYYNTIKYGNLIVKCVDENNTLLKQDTTTKAVGETYELSEQGETIDGYTFERVEGNLTGQYTEADTIVIYHYRKVKDIGRLIVRYVDEEDNLLEEDITSEEEDTPYNFTEEDLKKEIPGYEFKRIEGELQGTYKKEDTIIICHYNRIQEPEKEYGNLVVRCVDEDDQELDKTITTEEVGTTYELSEQGKQIDGYEFVRVEGNITGQYTIMDTIVTYHYRKVQTPKENGRVIVRYVDENNVLLSEDITTEEVDTPYSFTEQELKKEIPGYEFKRIEGELQGTYKKEDTIIICHYNKVAGPDKVYGNLIVRCVDENGQELKRTTTTEEVGTAYELSEQGEQIDGYRFVRVEGNTRGQYARIDTIVTYHYQKVEQSKDRGRVIILYVDENDAELQKDIKTEEVGIEYNFTKEQLIKEIPGYEIVSIEGELSGKYKKEDTIITCHYKKIKYGDLIILCVDENNKIIDKKVETKKVGTPYSVDSVGKEIYGYTFIGVEGKLKGEYKETPTVITYRYESIKKVTTTVKLPKTGEGRWFYITLGGIILAVISLTFAWRKIKSTK